MRVRVYIPDGNGPFPVMINTSLQGWAASLIRRGYISAGYAGNDAMDDAAPLAELYPDYDFALLPRRAWAASLVIDYLATLPQVDMKHIGIFGYSRDGKMVAIAAAMDTRIAAVIAGSTGVGGVLPWRASGERGLRRGHREHDAIIPDVVCAAAALLCRARRPAAGGRQSAGGDDCAALHPDGVGQ